MLKWLADAKDLFGPLRLFDYGTVRCLAALITAFVIMLIVMPKLIAWLNRAKYGEAGAKGDGQGEGARVVDAAREAKKGTPTMGGLGLVGCTVLAALLWCDLGIGLTWLLLLGMIGFAAVGYLDDRSKVFRSAHGIDERVKAAALIGVSAACAGGLWWWWSQTAHTPTTNGVGVAGTQMVFPFLPLESALVLGAWSIAWSGFVMFCSANAVNFTDGMDGLAAGTAVIAALAFAVIAFLVARTDVAAYLHLLWVPGGSEIAVLCCAIAGACLGFLWFNAAPAQVFMGDTGSQALGGVLGLAALAAKQEFLLLLVGAIFVAEGASVAIQRYVFKATKHRPQGGLRVFRCAPIHHHFQAGGMPETRIVIRMWIIAALAALLAVATLKVR